MSNIHGYPTAPSPGPGESREITKGPGETAPSATVTPQPTDAAVSTRASVALSASGSEREVFEQTQHPPLPNKTSLLTSLKENASSIAHTAKDKALVALGTAAKIAGVAKDQFIKSTTTIDDAKFKDAVMNFLNDQVESLRNEFGPGKELDLMVLHTRIKDMDSESEITKALNENGIKLPDAIRNESETRLSDRFDSMNNKLQDLKEAGQRKLGQILNTEKQAKSEALRNEALAALNIELQNPNLPKDEQERLQLAKAIITQAKKEDGSVNTDDIKGVLKQLNEGREENNKIGQRFLIEDTPKPNKLYQAANQVIDLAKSKISEIKNRDTQKNAEAMRKEVLGEIDERIKTGASSRAIDEARILIVGSKNAKGELNKGLTDKIGERFLVESSSVSTQNAAEKALGFLKDGIKFLTGKAVSLKDRIAPKTLEEADKKMQDAALSPIKTEGRARAQVVSGASSEKIKELQNLKDLILRDLDQNFIKDLRDAADSVSPFDDKGKPLSKDAYKEAVLSELKKVQDREEALSLESSLYVQDFYNSFSDVEKRGDKFNTLDSRIRDAHYRDGRLLSVEELHQNLDKILANASRGSRVKEAEKMHENRLNNLVKLYADKAPREDVRAAMKQISIRDSVGNLIPDKELEEQLSNILEIFK